MDTRGSLQEQGSTLIPQRMSLAPGDHAAGEAATFNGQLAQPLSNGVSAAGTTLALAAPAIILSGTAIARGPSDLVEGTNPILPATEVPEQLATGVAGSIVSVGTSNVALGSSTYALPAATGPEPVALSTLAPLSVGGQAAQYDPGPAGGVLIGDQTIGQGSQATISGTVSVGASNLNIDGSTYALPVPTAAVISVGSGNMMVGDSVHALPVDLDVIPLEVPVPVSIDGQVVQQASDGGIVVAGSTLKPGDMGVIISGTLISFDSVSDLILGSKTIPLETSAGGSDGLIMGGFGPKSSYATGLKGGPRNGTTINVLAIEGKAKALQGFTTWELLILPNFVSIVLLHK
ncbi:hypothetical protein OEA41_000151 [Lepraria neglecta]|uniref:Uncharacterized protein n=1 Tax=Lepraria neglecta TaxID=209136 RepID=A0AAD9ZF81_9LECA|nr:hypothetical protein OEA41_000151 [Lepraria neglecta]